MRRIILLATLSCLALDPARAEIACKTPMASWKPVAQLVVEAAKLGWTVQKVRADDGCYRVQAMDAQGRTVNAVFDPATLALLGQTDDAHDETGGHDATAKTGSN